MDISKIKKDYEEIRDFVLKEAFDTDINPIRCHEIIYLVNAGMKQKNYSCSIEDGFYENRIQHSWLKVKGNSFFDNVILHFIFHPYQFSSKPVYHDGILSTYKEKRQFKRKKINYELSEGIKELANKLFPY